MNISGIIYQSPSLNLTNNVYKNGTTLINSQGQIFMQNETIFGDSIIQLENAEIQISDP